VISGQVIPQHEGSELVTAQHHVERKLAAILAADVVGYGRLMGSDEFGTLQALKAHRRELTDQKISSHGGVIDALR
jgi:class 3 adenylate cyclase